MSLFGFRDALKRQIFKYAWPPEDVQGKGPSTSVGQPSFIDTPTAREPELPVVSREPEPELILTPRRRRKLTVPHEPTIPLPSGVRFRVMVLDPPWRYTDRLTMSSVKRGAAANYAGTMTFEDIRALPCRSLAADDAIMGLWVGNPIMDWGFELLAAWGFEFKQPWHWVKTSKAYKGKLEELDENGLAFGMGRLSRTCSETMLIGVRGKINDHLKSRRERNVIPYQALPHSRKPEVFQDRFDRMFPEGERLELFARRDRSNWTCVGNEAPATHGEDVFVSCNRLLGVSVGSQESMFAPDKPEVSP